MEAALHVKGKAIDECSQIVDGAVEELTRMAEGSDRFWRDLRSLKDGDVGKRRWAIVPKPDFGGTMADGEKAKDVIIPYAVDEGEAFSG